MHCTSRSILFVGLLIVLVVAIVVPCDYVFAALCYTGHFHLQCVLLSFHSSQSTGLEIVTHTKTKREENILLYMAIVKNCITSHLSWKMSFIGYAKFTVATHSTHLIYSHLLHPRNMKHSWKEKRLLAAEYAWELTNHYFILFLCLRVWWLSIDCICEFVDNKN